MFKNLDDMVEQLNGQTLQKLFEYCDKVEKTDDPASTLRSLANSFTEFVHVERNLWDAVMLCRFQPDHVRWPEYDQKVGQLLGLITEATAPYYTADTKDLRIHDARVPWASLYGMFALETLNRQAKMESKEALVASVVDFFVAAKTATSVS